VLARSAKRLSLGLAATGPNPYRNRFGRFRPLIDPINFSSLTLH
jgi:hypothetical protein